MPTSAIVCAECQNAWPQGAPVCPVCGSRVSHVGATGVQLGRANVATQAAPIVRRPRPSANGAATNGAATNGAATNGAATNGAATNGAAPSLQAVPEIAAALEAGIGLQGQTLVIERMVRRGGFCISYAARVAGLEQSAIVQELVPPGCVRRGREVVAARMTASEFENIKHRFEAEARSLLSFSHPDIVAARVVFEENNTFYLAMEAAPGQTLQERVEDSGPLAPGQAVGVIEQIGAMIVALHEAGLAHGDIRAANVSLSRAASVEPAEDASALERAMLNDWGLERWLEESYVLTGGVEAATSPESDVAGLAATLFFALTAQRPPASPHDAARLLGVSDAPEAESTHPISRPLAEAVLRGLERDPQHPLTARAWLQFLQPAAPPAKSTRANRTPFDALLSGQNKAASSDASPVARRAEAKPEARAASTAEPRAANRWIQDVALSVGGALLVGLAAWMLSTQTSNREVAAPTANLATPQANTDQNAANSAAMPIETPRALSAATPTPQVAPASQLSAPLPRANKPPQVAPQTIASPTPSAPIAPRRTSSRSAASNRSAASSPESSDAVKSGVTKRDVTAPRRLRRVEAAASPEIQPVAPRPRLRAARRLSASALTQRPPIERFPIERFPIERPQRRRVAPTVELPLEAPPARFQREVPRLRRRAANRAARRRMRRVEEPGLPPSAPLSSPPEPGLPPAP